MDNKISNNTSFGMALYMEPYKKFAKEFGKVAADEIEKARPALKKLAEDVDIFVKPSKAYFEPESENCWGVVMTLDKKDTPIMAKLRSLYREYNIFSNQKGYAFARLEAHPNNGELSKAIVDDVTTLKDIHCKNL